jgi:hypothetical protein
MLTAIQGIWGQQLSGTDIHNWAGNDWELFCFGLLQDRHGTTNVQDIPSKHKGDFGLDYCCKSVATAYQCYAAEDPLTTQKLAEKQRDKITADLKKFAANGKEIANFFGGIKVKRWILLVPRHESAEVVQHLGKKQKEILSENLDHVCTGFETAIHCLKSFNAENLALRLAEKQGIDLTFDKATSSQVSEFETAQSNLVENLMRKLDKRSLAGGYDPNGKKDALIKYFLERENTLDQLSINSPVLHEKIRAIIRQRTEKLEMLGNASDFSAAKIFANALDELQADLEKALPNLSVASAQAISLGTVAEWLLRCPLDFPPFSDAA